MTRARVALLTGAVVLGGSLAPLVVGAPDGQGESVDRVIEPLEVGPRAFFNDSCARCHGEDGWSYARGYTSKHTPEALRDEVKRMVEGPAQRQLDERGLEALTGFHYAIDAGDDGLFLAVTSWGETVAGEILPGTMVGAKRRVGGNMSETRYVTTGRNATAWSLDGWRGDEIVALWVEPVTSERKLSKAHEAWPKLPVTGRVGVQLFGPDASAPGERTFRGAWVATDRSGRVFGEVDPGE